MSSMLTPTRGINVTFVVFYGGNKTVGTLKETGWRLDTTENRMPQNLVLR